LNEIESGDYSACVVRRLRDGLLDKTNTASSVWADSGHATPRGL
jgi:hypothetical protein